MKKQLITLLMAGLLVVGFGGSALAAPVTITGTGDAGTAIAPDITSAKAVAEEKIPVNFIVTIPDTFKAGQTIAITSTSMVVEANKSVKVNVKDTPDSLTNGVLKLKGTNGANAGTLATTLSLIDSGQPIAVDGLVAEFKGGDNTTTATSGTGTIYTTEPVAGNNYADTYKGTIDFTIAYSDIVTP